MEGRGIRWTPRADRSLVVISRLFEIHWMDDGHVYLHMYNKRALYASSDYTATTIYLESVINHSHIDSRQLKRSQYPRLANEAEQDAATT